jgi:hypothetical protein
MRCRLLASTAILLNLLGCASTVTQPDSVAARPSFWAMRPWGMQCCVAKPTAGPVVQIDPELQRTLQQRRYENLSVAQDQLRARHADTEHALKLKMIAALGSSGAAPVSSSAMAGDAELSLRLASSL